MSLVSYKTSTWIYRWYQLTVYKSGNDPYMPASNLLSNVGNQSRGAVLAEPFPWTVSQGFILVFVIANSQLYVVALGMPTDITTLEPWWAR
jgi:hypothetical protein